MDRLAMQRWRKRLSCMKNLLGEGCLMRKTKRSIVSISSGRVLSRKNHQSPQLSDIRDSCASAPAKDEKGDSEGNGSLFGTSFVGPGRTIRTVDRSEHVRMVREVHEEVNQAREKVS